jgi:hypothetical protein
MSAMYCGACGNRHSGYAALTACAAKNAATMSAERRAEAAQAKINGLRLDIAVWGRALMRYRSQLKTSRPSARAAELASHVAALREELALLENISMIECIATTEAPAPAELPAASPELDEIRFFVYDAAMAARTEASREALLDAAMELQGGDAQAARRVLVPLRTRSALKAIALIRAL